MSARRRRAVNHRQLHILARRRAGQEIEPLKNETDLAIANVRELIAIERGHVCITRK